MRTRPSCTGGCPGATSCSGPSPPRPAFFRRGPDRARAEAAAHGWSIAACRAVFVPRDRRIVPGVALAARLRHAAAEAGDGDLSRGRLAAIACLSPHYFIRRFRASTGTPPPIRHPPPDRGAVELLRSGRGVADATARVGLSGQSHLHRHVRRPLGVIPVELSGAGPRLSGVLLEHGHASHAGHPRPSAIAEATLVTPTLEARRTTYSPSTSVGPVGPVLILPRPLALGQERAAHLLGQVQRLPERSMTDSPSRSTGARAGTSSANPGAVPQAILARQLRSRASTTLGKACQEPGRPSRGS
jgi:AraC-like DNA-binding protein